MLIESIIRRQPHGQPAGSTIYIERTAYRFAVQPALSGCAKAHVCDVKNPLHAQQLLAITEGFRPAPKAKPKAKPKKVVNDVQPA